MLNAVHEPTVAYGTGIKNENIVPGAVHLFEVRNGNGGSHECFFRLVNSSEWEDQTECFYQLLVDIEVKVPQTDLIGVLPIGVGNPSLELCVNVFLFCPLHGRIILN